MSDQPDKPEDGDSASGTSATPEPELVTEDEVHLADPEVSADAVEPTLGTSAEEVHLSEPSLGAAEISEDAADAAALDEAAAEAESVAREAEEVGTLVGGPRPAEDPAEAAAPSGTAPAGGTAGDIGAARADVPDHSAAEDGNEPSDAVDALDEPIDEDDSAGPVTPGASAETAGGGAEGAAPESPWAQPFPATHPKAAGSPVPPVGGPYALPPATAPEAPPTRIRARSARSSSRGPNRKKLIVLGLIGVVVLALLILAITSIVGALRPDDSDAGSTASTTPGADGIIAESISPLELTTGACILGFDSTEVSADVTTVTCATPHNAQLLATTSLPEDAEFPGEAALNASGEDLCNSVPIDEGAAAEHPSLTLTQVTPTSDTWADGDRRIDCFVVSDEGNIITDTLLAE